MKRMLKLVTSIFAIIFLLCMILISVIGGKWIYHHFSNISGLASKVSSYQTAGEAAKPPEGAIRVKNKKKFVRAVYDMALARIPKGSFYYEGDYNQIFDGNIDSLLKRVCAIDDKETSDDADYLENSISSINVNTSYNYIGNVIIDSTITITINYLETAAQLEKVNQKVEQVLDDLGINNKSKYKKIKLIHDYIVNNTTYAATAHSHTAYGALIEGKAVCQGYTQLAYKMLTDAGVLCHYIAGQAYNGKKIEDHAWNIVKLGGKWYYVDVTWDDPTGAGDQLRYDYFLKGRKMFHKDHIALTDYKKWISKVSKNNYRR